MLLIPLRKYAIGMMAGLLAACATPNVGEYRDEKPIFDLRQYFDGTLDAWGIVQDRSGKVTKRFHVVIKASWQGDVGTLDEDFTYSDGTKQQRVWTVKRLADGRYSGTAGDVVGEAKGEAAGNALRRSYVLQVPVDGKTYDLVLDDWMFLMEPRILINRTEMTKFGVRLGEISIFFVKR